MLLNKLITDRINKAGNAIAFVQSDCRSARHSLCSHFMEPTDS